MESKINIAELLKGCSKGMELDCTMFDRVFLEEIIDDEDLDCPILIKTKEGETWNLTSTGCWDDSPSAKCVIFPKGKTSWEGFHRPFVDGDIVAIDSAGGSQVFIFEEYIRGEKDYAHCYMMLDDDGAVDLERGEYYVERFATEEEKEKLFQAIRDNGYKWNAETKTLGKLIKPIFKAENLQPYKEAPMYLNEKANKQAEEIAEIIEPVKEIMEEIKLDIPDGYEFFGIDDNNKIVLTKKQPQYPKTFIEVLNFWHPDRHLEDDYQRCYKKDLIEKFQDLLYARDAYWKIAGEEMGLGKPWEPDWNHNTEKHAIYPYQYHYSIDKENYRNTILAFPTAEMRDVFFENFKELIDNAKELL